MEPKNKVQTQINSDKNNGQQSARSGIPIPTAPDIRKEVPKSKNYLWAFLIAATLGSVFYFVSSQDIRNESINQETVIESSKDLAQNFLSLSNEESQDDFAIHGTEPDDTSKATPLNLPEKIQTKMKDVTKKVVNHLEENPGTEGILSKCRIHGHDVHFIDRSGMILSHVREGQGLSPKFERAREIIMLNKNQGDLAIVVTKENLEIYNIFGELQAKECINCPKP
jgi:hypothetical protein